jgi:hemin uptake protein HemP
MRLTHEDHIMADRLPLSVLPSSAPSGANPTSAAAVPRPAQCCDDRDVPCQVCKEIGVRVVNSDELLQGARELLIVHAGQVYRLLRTRNDKLILQK